MAAATLSVTPSASAEDVVPLLLHAGLGPVPDIASAKLLVQPSDATLEALAVGESAPLYETEPSSIEVSDGQYSIGLRAEDVPAAYLSEDGVAHMKVLLRTSQDDTYVTGASVRLVDTGDDSPLWVDPAENLEAFSSTNTKTSSTSTYEDPTGDVSEYEYEDDGVLSVPAVKVATGEPTPPAGCGNKKLDTRKRPTTIGTTYPVGGDVASMQVSSSAGASYGVAVSVKDSAGKYGEFRAAEGKFTRSGWGFHWSTYSGSRSYRKGIEYGLYETSCVRGCNACFRQWYPTSETGGTGSNTGITRPDWTTCVQVDPGTWWRDSSAGRSYTYGAAVKFASVIGVDLSIDRDYR